MRVLICGDRNWRDEDMINQVIEDLKAYYNIRTVIEGEANGADLLARRQALRQGVDVIAFPANWKKYGKAAGPIRNQRMLADGKPDLVIAFHDNIIQSKGTRHMVETAQRADVPVILMSHA